MSDSEVLALAAEQVRQLTELDLADGEARAARRARMEALGHEVQRRAARQVGLLEQPVSKLAGWGQDGGDVARDLIALKLEVEKLDPGKLDLEPGWFTRLLGRLPGVGTPLRRYFSRYESARTVIEAIARSLELGKDQLLRDCITLEEDRRQLQETVGELDRTVRLGQELDRRLQAMVGSGTDDPRHRFVVEDLLFPLRQRVLDLQQQLVVSQQGLLAIDLVVRNNRELARGVDRALHVTVTALQVGATVAMAIAHQRVVLDGLEAVNRTTSGLLAGTASRLRAQGAEIHARAAGTQLDLGALRSAFTDLRAALDDVTRFRAEALPAMAASVLELDRLSAEAAQALEQGGEG